VRIQIDDEVSQRRAGGRWRPLGRAVFAALFAFLIVGPSAYAQTGGDGTVSGGEECDPPASSCPGYENGLGGCQLFFRGNPAAAPCTTGGDCFYAFSCCKFNQQYVGASNIQCEDGNDCTGLTYCDQVGGCTLVQDLNLAGTPCGPPGTICDPADQCDAAGACQPVLAPTTTECRAAGGICDAAEFCDGAGNCPNDVFTPAGTACGDPGTECTIQDTCDGSGVCTDNGFEAVGTSCGDAGTECIVQDTCNGAGTCDDNGFVSAGTACGDPTNSTCNGADTCNGSGACLDNFAATTLVCNPDAGECDVPEYCDGAGNCPTDQFEPSGTACGDATATDCNLADTCNGAGTCDSNLLAAGDPCGDSSNTTCTNPDTCDASGACQPNNAATTVECRGEANACDVAEFCDGAGSCPADAFEPVGTACGDQSDTTCTDPDTCDGSGTCLENNEPTTVSCRADAGECDVEEFCDGAGGCPAQAFEPAGTACGDSASTSCDAADTCDGSGQCDDNYATSGTACGDPSDTTCTDPDTCDGSGSCQANDAATTVECRSGAGECDVAEYCDGAGSCPGDSFESAGTACGSQADTSCTNPDTCDGSGTCLENDEPTTVLCRADAGDCDVPEYCDGAGSCPAESFEPAGTACGDGTATDCNLADSCDASGTCQSNLVAPGVACGDPTSTTCNQADTCDGSGSCDPNYAATTVQCRAAGGACDAGEFCNGAGGCDPDVLTPAGTTCRDSTDVCDPAETCTGASADCPSDGLAPDCTVCSTGDFCEAPGLCTGGVCFPGPEVIVEKVAKLGRAASSTSDITVNASNGRAIFVKNARMEDDTIVAATTVKLALQASIDDVATSNLVNNSDKGEVRGAVLPPFTSDVPCPSLTFACGGESVVVGYLEERTLSPGSYGNIDVKLDGRLNFEEGEYEICIMKANRNSVLSILPGATGDQTVLRFEKGLILGENVTLVPTGGALPPRIEAGKFITSPNCNIQANILTTDGITKLGRDSFFNGTICAQSLKANANVQIGCDSPQP
jgi:hypothetical protein